MARALLLLAILLQWTPGQANAAACPPDQPGMYWTQLTNDTCTGVTMFPSAFGWQESGSNFTCGPSLLPTVLQSSKDAMALARIVPANGTAWVELVAKLNATTGNFSWVWPASTSSQPASSYGCSDGSSWIDGTLPTPAPGLCSVLRSDGLLQASPCERSATIHAACCSIPACTCLNASGCSSAIQLADGQGYGCSTVPPLRVASYTVFSAGSLTGVNSSLLPAVSRAAGCGRPINGTVDTLTGLPRISLLPGDMLRVCGTFPGGTQQTTVHFPTLLGPGRSPMAARECDGSLGLPPTVCLEFVVSTGVSTSAVRSATVSPVAAARGRTCSVRSSAATPGAVACWGNNLRPFADTSYVDVPSSLAVPSDLLPVAALAIGGGSHSCAVIASTGAVRCWGWNENNQSSVPPDLPPATSVAVGMYHSCVLLQGGMVRCWGRDDNGQVSVPTDVQEVTALVAAATYNCALLGGTRAGQIRCWGKWNSGPAVTVPPDLPPVQQVAAGTSHTCVSAVRTGAVSCFGPDVIATPPPLPPVAALAAGFSTTCVILAQNGTVRCFGTDVSGHASGPRRLTPMASLHSYDSHSCSIEVGTGLVVCWGSDDFGESSPPTDLHGLASSALPPHSHSFLLQDGVSVAPFRADLNGELHFKSAFIVGTSSILLQLEQVHPNSTVPSPPPFLFQTASDLKYPVVMLYTRGNGTVGPVRRACVLHVESAYELRCDGGLSAYGAEALAFDGQHFVSQGNYSLPGIVQLEQARVAATAGSRPLTPSSLDLAVLSAQIRTSTLASGEPTLLLVRPGDTVTLFGSNFRLHALLASTVPWWPSTGVPSRGHLRSCIHLAWWASLAAYHDASACVCNGQEDWLGEGELPWSSISVWNDTVINFTAPVADGIREVRLCIENTGQDSPARSSSSIYLVWDPPTLEKLLPAAFVDSTDTDTDVSLQVASTSIVGDAVPPWGPCGVTSAFTIEESGRAWYRTPVPSDIAFARLRHCTCTPLVEVSLGRCYAGTGYSIAATAWPRSASTPSTCVANLTWTSPAEEPVIAVGAFTSLPVPLPDSMPNALLNVSVSLSIWDGGLRVAASPALSVLTFSRALPEIKSLSPNPLLLGPVGGGGPGDPSPQARLTIYGAGLRTPEEVADPRNGLLGFSSTVEVLISGVVCTNVSVSRSSTRFATVTCTYPSAVVGGGVLPVTLRMLGIESSLRAEDGSTVALSAECAEGYYGQFDVVDHQLCRPCPAGGQCRGGVGRVPVATFGFYNMGLPPRTARNDSDALVRYRTVSAARGASCPARAADSGRDVACIMPCEPVQACLGGNVCAEGYVSVPPVFRCARCAPKYYRSSGVCVPCPVLGVGGVLVLVCALLLLASAMYVLSSNAIRLCTLSTVLEYGQIISLMQGPTLPWPPAVQGALRAFSILRVNIEVSAPECYSAISLTPEAKLWAVVVLPIAVVACAASVFVLAGLVKRARQQQDVLQVATSWGTMMTSMFDGGTQSSAWSHGPACFRTALKLLALLYLPVVQACLEVWNCTPTTPPDGREYLSIVFEECALPGGLQERMIPWAAMGLLAYGIFYPVALALFLYRYQAIIIEDQMLLAAGTGKDERSNPRAYFLRQYAAPLYEDYRPGYQYGALLTLGRKALVCICALMLNKSAVLKCGGIVFVVAVVLTLQATTRPLMTPGPGFVACLSQFWGRLQAHRTAEDELLYKHLCEIAEDTQHPQLVQLSAGQMACTDADGAARPWWTTAIEWNNLEAELQLQVLLTGILAMMYESALESVYAARAVPAVTAIFFLLLTTAAGHIAVTVGYDLFLQVRRAAQAYIANESGAAPSNQVLAALASVPPWRMFLVVLCPCTMTSARARAVLAGKGRAVKSQADCGAARDGRTYAHTGVEDWLSNPLDAQRRAPPGDASSHSSTLKHHIHSSPPPAVPDPQPRDMASVSPAAVSSCPAHSTAGGSTRATGGGRMTLRRARLQAMAASVRLTAIQRCSRFVQVDVEEMEAMVDPPLEEDWRLIRQSFMALWELVEEGEQRAVSKTEEFQAQVRSLQDEVGSLRALLAACNGPGLGSPSKPRPGSDTGAAALYP